MTHKRFDLLLTELENIEGQAIHPRDSLLRARAAEAIRMLRSELDQAQQATATSKPVYLALKGGVVYEMISEEWYVRHSHKTGNRCKVLFTAPADQAEFIQSMEERLRETVGRSHIKVHDAFVSVARGAELRVDQNGHEWICLRPDKWATLRDVLREIL